jgi:hypothetical protein
MWPFFLLLQQLVLVLLVLVIHFFSMSKRLFMQSYCVFKLSSEAIVYVHSYRVVLLLVQEVVLVAEKNLVVFSFDNNVIDDVVV